MVVNWNVSARKLESTDTHPHLSPSFDLSFGESRPHVPFKLLIKPKAHDDKKGGASFKKANGRGYVELVCEEALPARVPEVTFRIAVGTGKRRQPFSDPVTHNFAERKIGSLPGKQAEWNFHAAVDRESQTLEVCLEILPQSGVSFAQTADASAAPDSGQQPDDPAEADGDGPQSAESGEAKPEAPGVKKW